jgi:hypothetical protein
VRYGWIEVVKRFDISAHGYLLFSLCVSDPGKIPFAPNFPRTLSTV